MVSIAIAQNHRERRIAEFPFWNDDAHSLMEKLASRHIPAVAGWSTDDDARIIAWTDEYWTHAA